MDNKIFTREGAYWYARGYLDGREFGTENNLAPQEHRHAYKEGYGTGIADYAEACNVPYDSDYYEFTWPVEDEEFVQLDLFPESKPIA